jgi:hypothetical protein
MKVREPAALPRQAVEVRRGVSLRTEAAEVAIAQVIGKY